MKKVFRIENLDCATCANRLENAIRKVDGVKGAVVNFLTLRLCLEYDENEQEVIFSNVKKTAKKTIPDCTILGI